MAAIQCADHGWVTATAPSEVLDVAGTNLEGLAGGEPEKCGASNCVVRIFKSLLDRWNSVTDSRTGGGGHLAERVGDQSRKLSCEIRELSDLGQKCVVEMSLALKLPTSQYLDGVPGAGSFIIDDPVMPSAQQKKVVEALSVVDLMISART
ncbi:hypothetical protein GCM10009554_43670 [Kribbella koreensis]|uniref:Uncharacterized protein n=1 Tax=Kribbella koreensis TaxID=57909 RepID=A0ABN1QTJ6_9ACTN